MNSRGLSLIAIAGFILVGAICIGLRYKVRQEARTAREDTEWELTCATKFKADLGEERDQARVWLPLPFDTQYCQLLNANDVTLITSPNLRSEPRGPFKWTGNRVLSLTTRQEGTYEASAKFRLRMSPRASAPRQLILESLAPDARAWYLRDEPRVIPVNSDILRQKLPVIVGDATTDGEKLQLIFQFCAQIDDKAAEAKDDVVDALTNNRGTPLARVRAMVALSRASRIPARPVAGFRIVQGSDVKPHVWVEVFNEQVWVPFDPTDGYSFNMPMTYVPVRRGGGSPEELASDQVIEFRNVVDQPATTFSIRVMDRDPSLLLGEVPHPLQMLNLTRLPVKMHKVMKILLLLPFAALITAILRNVVGLKSFGTFSPALLAMSFIYADLKTGLVILAIVISVGLVGRTFLEKLRLLMVPRLSIILTMVILCVVFGISILHYILPNVSAEVVLLPMVIMTMLIERFHVSAEEDGMAFTLQLAAGTLLVAVLCYLVLRWDEVGELALTYPETHFFTIAAFIFLGRYAGYRLTELWRFSDLVDTGGTGR